MTIHDAGQQLLFTLYHIYDQDEAANIADWVMENITGWKKIDRRLNNTVRLSEIQQNTLEKYTTELSAHTPVQYVLNEAWFCRMKFYVDNNVLIPRPETEELVEWVVTENKSARILDIGTGSGCIAIALKKKIPEATVYACDISKEALVIAKKNATANNVVVEFLEIDILKEEERNKLPVIDIIISNPPYIPESDKSDMNRNVLDHEPHLALFVDNNDPLIFYKAIKNINAKRYYFETHAQLAQRVAELFSDAAIKKDMQGKERMVKIQVP